MILTKRRVKNYINIVLLVPLLLLLQITAIYASSDFNISSSFNIYLEKKNDNFVTIEETLEIKAINSGYYIPANSEQTILMKKDELIKDTLKVTNRYGRLKNHKIKETEESYQIVIINDSNITQNNPFFAKIAYQTKEFINQNGNVTNLYLPGLHEGITFLHTDPTHGLKTTYDYSLNYYVPIDSSEPSYISPSSISTNTTKDYHIYSFPQEDRIGNAGWIQLGEEQFYKFKITQKIPQTDFLTPESLSRYTTWLSTNILELALPREFAENNQEVFITKITPEPKRIRADEEGNLVGIFEMAANQEKEVTIEGYIKLSKTFKEIPDFSITEYKERIQELAKLGTYTQPDTYWESDSDEIIDVAERLLEESDSSSVMSLIRNNYNFVIDSLEYSTQKAEGDNIRFGALRALQGQESVCMEYADLMIAILRAQGIPSRAAFGYGNDPLITDTQREIGHQWVQIWMPDYGWLSVDPTWGETGREYIGGDLDHMLWYAIGDSKQRATDFAIYTADFLDPEMIEAYSVSIEPLHKEDVTDLTELQTIGDLSLEYKTEEEKEVKEIEYVLKTTMVGRILIFIIPIAIILLVITSISILISRLLKRR